MVKGMELKPNLARYAEVKTDILFVIGWYGELLIRSLVL
jgi:hypothetical protein